MASTADLQVMELRCEQMLDGRYLGGPVACGSALEGYVHDHPSERIASVLPLSPTSPPKYFSLEMTGATESLLVLHTPKWGPWPRARDLHVQNTACKNDPPSSNDFDCAKGPDVYDLAYEHVHGWVPIDDPSLEGGTQGLIEISSTIYPPPPPSLWPSQANVQRTRLSCSGPQGCQGALEQYLRGHPTEHIGLVWPVTPRPPQSPHDLPPFISHGTELLFVEHTRLPVPWPRADRLAIRSISCLGEGAGWDCVQALEDHRQAGIWQWIPLIEDCGGNAICTREILYLYEQPPAT